jgi:hypothetical protein
MKTMNLQEIVDQMELCNYECEGGPLVNNVAFIELRKMAMRETVMEHYHDVDDNGKYYGWFWNYEDKIAQGVGGCVDRKEGKSIDEAREEIIGKIVDYLLTGDVPEDPQ